MSIHSNTFVAISTARSALLLVPPVAPPPLASLPSLAVILLILEAALFIVPLRPSGVTIVAVSLPPISASGSAPGLLGPLRLPLADDDVVLLELHAQAQDVVVDLHQLVP